MKKIKIGNNGYLTKQINSEEKRELIEALKLFCPYKLLAEVSGKNRKTMIEELSYTTIEYYESGKQSNDDWMTTVDCIIPYLRLPESMTQEEKAILNELKEKNDFTRTIKYLSKLHIDTNNLIKRDLAYDINNGRDPYEEKKYCEEMERKINEEIKIKEEEIKELRKRIPYFKDIIDE